jgi:hypothetical protein
MSEVRKAFEQYRDNNPQADRETLFSVFRLYDNYETPEGEARAQFDEIVGAAETSNQLFLALDDSTKAESEAQTEHLTASQSGLTRNRR